MCLKAHTHISDCTNRLFLIGLHKGIHIKFSYRSRVSINKEILRLDNTLRICTLLFGNFHKHIFCSERNTIFIIILDNQGLYTINFGISYIRLRCSFPNVNNNIAIFKQNGFNTCVFLDSIISIKYRRCTKNT